MPGKVFNVMNRIAFAAACLSMMFLGSGCKVVATGSSTYDTCYSTADCLSGYDSCIPISNAGLRDNQCTRSCLDDFDCPGSGHCVSFDGIESFCYQRCVTNSACEWGWGCTDLSDGSAVCLPGSGTPAPTGIPAYNECDPSADTCVSSVEGCFTIQVDRVAAGVCTSSCVTADTCPITANGLSGECISFDSGRNYTCFEACRDSNDCLEGFACKSSLATGERFPPVCLPI